MRSRRFILLLIAIGLGATLCLAAWRWFFTALFTFVRAVVGGLS